MDLKTEISADHRLIEGRVERLISPFTPNHFRQAALRELEVLLGSHHEAEEKTVYAVAKNLGALEQSARHQKHDHRSLDNLLDSVKIAPGSAIRKARALALSRLLRRHIREEEQDFLPSLTKQISPEENDRLARRYRHLMDVSRETCGTVIPFPNGL
jgi:hemerythrin superfamily protein